ncbi:MAG: GatB/YqeY domain-containing protein [Dehalococcoidia bacterium]|nr:GatB/YqeY domain-containing protein [Dehalococcoidia bacterium]
MAPIQEQIQQDLNRALRERDAVSRDALRLLTTALNYARIESGKDLTDEDVLGVIQKQVKQRRESIAEYEKASRQDLADKERAEMEVFQRYLPEQATPEEIEAAAREVIASTGASSQRDMGKVMPVLTKKFSGRADGKQVSEIVRSLLA